MARHRRHAIAGMAAVAAILAGASACSTASSGSGSPAQSSAGQAGGGAGSATGSAATGSASGGIAQAAALIQQYSGEPAFVSPGPSFDAAKAAGKTILGLPASTSVAYVETVDQQMAAYAKTLGIKYVDYPNQQEQSQWIQGVSQAISVKANVLNLITGIPPEQLAPQLQQAQAAGVKVVDLAERNAGQPTQSYVNSYIYAPFETAGQLMGAWAVKATSGKADVLIISSDADVSSAPIVTGATSEIKSTCPSCTIKTVNVNPADWATELQSTVEGALSSDPNINYILPVFDSMAEFAAPAIEGSGHTGKTFIATFNGTPSILDMMRTGDIVTMDAGNNTSDVALAGLDASMRLMLGLPAGKQQVELRVFDKSNVSQAGVPAKSGEGFGDSSAQGYAKTWGVSPSLLGG
jgi:ribose transport system substrate-binding protein